MRLARRASRAIKPLFAASVLAAGLMSCSKPDKPSPVPMLPMTPKVCEKIEMPEKQPDPPGLYTQHEIKVVRRGDYVLRSYFPLEKNGILSLRVSEVGKKGITLSGDTDIFRSKKPILLKYGKRTEFYGSVLVLTLHAQQNGPNSAIMNVSYVADKP